MDQFTTNKIRNVILLGHSGSGKTSLLESFLFASKSITRMGSIEQGTTVSDFDPEEQRRHSSLQLSVAACSWNGHKINLLDTPGYADFAGETSSALRAADAAIIVLAAPSGVEVGTEQVWKQLRASGIPVIIFVTKMSRENANYQTVVDQVRNRLGKECVPITFPVGAESSFSGVVDVLSGEIPSDLQTDVMTARDQIVEAVAETDDALTEKYLDEGTLEGQVLIEGLRAGIRSAAVVPVMAGDSVTSGGVSELLDAILAYMPGPADISPPEASKDGSPISLRTDSSDPLVALVFKTSADPFVGKVSYLRVISGTLASNQEAWDATKNETERIGQIFVPVGKSQEAVTKLEAGDIGCVPKLAHAVTGDTITLRSQALTLPRIDFPQAVYQVAVHPKSKADSDKMSSAIARLTEEDPSLRVAREQATGELIVTGMGDTHVEVMAERARRKFGVDLELSPPKVAYRETIGKVAKVEYKHKKQTGGSGQYGHVLLRLEPRARGEGYEFSSEVVGGNVPKEYIPAVEKGVVKALGEGAHSGYPIVDMRVVLYDGSSHSVDSSGASFEIAGLMALKKGVTEAEPVLLQPVMKVNLVVPEEYTGAVVGDLNSRHARIGGMSPSGGIAVIEAEVPQSEAQQYSTTLRALTQGRGSMTMSFDHYGEVPAHVAQKIVSDSQGDANKG